jgi:hypothetical protein
MRKKAKCEFCTFAVPTVTVAGTSTSDWEFPRDYECSFGHAYYPDLAHLCVDHKCMLERPRTGGA